MADNDEQLAMDLQNEEIADAANPDEDAAQAAIRRQRELAARHGM